MLTLPVVWFLASGEGSGAGIVAAVSGSGQVTNGAFWNAAFGSRWWTNLLDTPAVYALELGIVGILATVEIVRRVRGSVAVGPADRKQIVILLGILALVTFLRPPVDSPNNLYARPMLLVYLMLAPFAVRAVDGTAMRQWHRTAIIVCGLGTAYAVVGILLQGLLFWGIPTALADACSWTTRETPRYSHRGGPSRRLHPIHRVLLPPPVGPWRPNLRPALWGNRRTLRHSDTRSDGRVCQHNPRRRRETLRPPGGRHDPRSCRPRGFGAGLDGPTLFQSRLPQPNVGAGHPHPKWVLVGLTRSQKL